MFKEGGGYEMLINIIFNTDRDADWIKRVMWAKGELKINRDYIQSITEVKPGFAKGFLKGQESIMRKNQSGCCCIVDDDCKITSVCDAHKNWLDEINRKDNMIPKNTLEGLERYVKDRIHPGDFLQAVLENDLALSFSKADDENRKAMFEIVNYIYNIIPSKCWGSSEQVRRWLDGNKGKDYEGI